MEIAGGNTDRRSTERETERNMEWRIGAIAEMGSRQHGQALLHQNEKRKMKNEKPKMIFQP